MNQNANHIQKHVEFYQNEILAEIEMTSSYQTATKDILIVVHNQLEYVQKCIESIKENTSDYTLYIWDNNSDQATKDYLRSLTDIVLIEHDSNIGFGEPNNNLAKLGKSEYIICLNSDTVVLPCWSEALITYLQLYPECAETGYQGCLLHENGEGGRKIFGGIIDYLAGFCICISRKTYDEFGLFDPIFKFAYCEDSDLSLRLKAAGKKLYALHLPLVYHFQNKTADEVMKDDTANLAQFSFLNHEIFYERWLSYLRTKRVEVEYNIQRTDLTNEEN